MLFTNDHINMKALKQRAFNLRWATVAPDTIPLTAADPDFMSAPEIAAAINRYTAERTFAYGPAEGLQSFKEAIVEMMEIHRNVKTLPTQILPIDSAAQGMFIVAKYCLQPGDEAIIFDPVDFLFKKSVEAAGATPVLFPIEATTGNYSIEQLTDLVTPKTKMLCLCNPLNPIGKVFSKQELEQLGQFAVEHDLWIMNDEIWSDIVFPEASFTSIAALDPQIAQRTITVFGFSKSYGLAGLRVGYIYSPTPLIHEGIVETSMVKTTAYGVSTLSQVAAEAALKECRYWLNDFLAHLTLQRNMAVSMLNSMKGVSCHNPQGCYLVFPNITQTGKSSTAIADYLMKQAKVAVVPGAEQWFGPGAEGHIRICISTSESILKEGLERMQTAFAQL
jgi:aminotransferase